MSKLDRKRGLEEVALIMAVNGIRLRKEQRTLTGDKQDASFSVLSLLQLWSIPQVPWPCQGGLTCLVSEGCRAAL